MIGAFFDIDGTVMRESIMLKHFNKLKKYGIIPNDDRIYNLMAKYEAYEKRYGDYDDFISEMGNIYKEKLTGLEKALIMATAKQVIEEGGEMVYAYTRDRIKYHKEQGHKVFFVSGSPTYLVQMLGEIYGVDEGIGTDYTFDQEDIFTGQISQMWDSDSKLVVINDLVEKYNINIDESYAYGDTNGDYTMLKTMKNATAINPSKRFLQKINSDDELKERANVIVERKDVIYKLSPSVDQYEISSDELKFEKDSVL